MTVGPGAVTRKLWGCGCVSVLAAILVIATVGWLLSLGVPLPKARRLGPVPDNVPPQAPAAVHIIDVHGPGRTADQLFDWSQEIATATDMPGQALRAYANAELIARDAWPECHLSWNTLAGLGWVETRHGTYNGNWFNPSQLDSAGRPQPPIVGIALNGTNGTAVIPDTDEGTIDGDAEHDRAVGPMQFIPESWRRYGRDADGDGVPDPQQIDDAALGAAALLCAHGRDLSQQRDWVDAIFAYNQSEEYMRRVASAANSYAIGQPATS